jgi:hypothetical protein
LSVATWTSKAEFQTVDVALVVDAPAGALLLPSETGVLVGDRAIPVVLELERGAGLMTPSSPAWNDIGCPVAGKSACVLGGAASVSVNMGLERRVGEYVREEIDAGH